MKMKYTSLVLRIVAPIAIGIGVGRFITPLLNLESLWLNIVVSTAIAIMLFILIENIISKLTTITARTIPLGEIKNLHKVKKHEIPQAAGVLADAFTQDPLFQALFGDASKNTHKYKMVAEFMMRYCYKYGNIYASSEKFEGIMAITQDKYTYMSFGRMIRSGSILSIFLIGLISWIKVITALSPLDALRSKHMKNKSFAYLQIIGVAQEYQGKGHGGKLMKEFITLAEEVSIPIYLETETASNVTFYKKYGFKTLEQIHLTGIYNPMWLMIRDSKNSS